MPKKTSLQNSIANKSIKRNFQRQQPTKKEITTQIDIYVNKLQMNTIHGCVVQGT